MLYLTTLFTIIPRRCVGCQDMEKQKGVCENTNAFHNDYDFVQNSFNLPIAAYMGGVNYLLRRPNIANTHTKNRRKYTSDDNSPAT